LHISHTASRPFPSPSNQKFFAGGFNFCRRSFFFPLLLLLLLPPPLLLPLLLLLLLQVSPSFVHFSTSSSSKQFHTTALLAFSKEGWESFEPRTDVKVLESRAIKGFERQPQQKKKKTKSPLPPSTFNSRGRPIDIKLLEFERLE
jgi:hypothetical protein